MNDLYFLRDRVNMFEQANPIMQAKAAKAGTRGASFGGRGEFDPYRERIQGGLLTGNIQEVSAAIRDWMGRHPEQDPAGVLRQIKSVIQANAPIKPAGSTSLDSTLQFLQWAKQNLPEAEARKIFALAETYAKTAKETQLFQSSKPIQQLSRLNYDSFRAPRAPLPRSAAEASARVQLQRAIRAGQIARALQQVGQ
jgi:hypothetical protein